jgi:peptidoglycan hydrolase-like protein with peptidoglycan-binding domain
MATSTSKSSAPASKTSTSTSTASKASTTTSAPVGKNISTLSNNAIQVAVGAKADGIYGANTTASVKSFQAANGLKADGIVGPQTAAAITASLNAGNYGTASKSSTTSTGGGGGTAVSTPVVSGGTATSEINNKIIPTINDSKVAMANQALTQAEQKKANMKLQEDLNAKFGGSPGYKMLAIDGVVGPKTKKGSNSRG